VHANPRGSLLVQAWRWISLRWNRLSGIGYLQTDLYELLLDPHQEVKLDICCTLFDHFLPRFQTLYLTTHKS
jgi:hypothetical protein